MAQRRFHYEQAFEHYLRANRIPYVAVDEAKKSLIPPGHASGSIKSFDFVVYAADRNLLVDVKGRMYGSGARRGGGFESWVTLDDVEGLKHWRTLFGPGFEAIFVFAYCLRQQPPDALFEEVFAYGKRLVCVAAGALGSVLPGHETPFKQMEDGVYPGRDLP